MADEEDSPFPVYRAGIVKVSFKLVKITIGIRVTPVKSLLVLSSPSSLI